MNDKQLARFATFSAAMLLFAAILTGCATMNEEDKALWGKEEKPAAKQP